MSEMQQPSSNGRARRRPARAQDAAESQEGIDRQQLLLALTA